MKDPRAPWIIVDVGKCHVRLFFITENMKNISGHQWKLVNKSNNYFAARLYVPEHSWLELWKLK